MKPILRKAKRWPVGAAADETLVSTELTDNPGEWEGALSGVLMPTFLAVPAVEPPGALASVGVVVGVTRASIEARVRVAGRWQCCGGRGWPWSW